MGDSGSLERQSHLFDVSIHERGTECVAVADEETCSALSSFSRPEILIVETDQTLCARALLFIAGMSYRGL